MNYRDAVKEGRGLVERQDVTQWALGDLALEVAPMGGNAANNGSTDKLEQFADDIGIEFDTLRVYRQMAATFPPETRISGTSWSAHRALQSKKHLLKPRMTLTQARKAAGVNDRARQPVNERPSIREQLAQADPEEIEDAYRDPVTGPVLRRASGRVTQEQEDQAREQQRDRAPGLVNAHDFYAIATNTAKAKRLMAENLRLLEDTSLEDEERETLLEGVESLKVVVGWVESFLASGDRSFDAALERLLTEEV